MHYLADPSLADDLLDVLARAKAAGVQSAVLTGGSLHESNEALELAEQHGKFEIQIELPNLRLELCGLGLFATVGCHPTRSSQFDSFKGGPAAYLERLDQLIASHLTGKGRCVAVGECGLGKLDLIIHVVCAILSLTENRLRSSTLLRRRNST